MYRCLELAKKGAGNVAPNPMVGAVLVCNDRIIGEGYHEKYGEAHAEVKCLDSVKEEDRHLISRSAMYVSLEPCVHFGKTPPCTDLIIKHKIPRVVIGCRDPFKEVNGKGIEKLKGTGVIVEAGTLEKECKELNKRFFVFQKLHRPYIILKWAETSNGFIGNEPGGKRLLITNEYTSRLVHKWRSEEASILIGTNTALVDDPELTTRFWKGNNPIRMVVDMDLKLPSTLKIFSREQSTIVFNTRIHSDESEWSSPSPLVVRAGVRHYQVTEDVSLVHQILNALYQLNIQSVMVEGGAKLLQAFIDEGSWDEARLIKNSTLIINNGLPAPRLDAYNITGTERIFSDSVTICSQLMTTD